MTWLLLLAQSAGAAASDMPGGAAGGLVGGGLTVAGVLWWLTRVLIPRMQDDAARAAQKNAETMTAIVDKFDAALETRHRECREERRELTDTFRSELAAERDSRGELAKAFRRLTENLGNGS